MDQQNQSYDYEPVPSGGSGSGSSQKALPWKPILIGAGGFVLAILFIILVVRLMSPPVSVDLATARSQVDDVDALCASAEDPDGCASSKVTDLAEQFGEADLCEDLESVEEIDNCLWGVARETLDADLCASLSAIEDAMKCHDGVYLLIASDADDPELCLSINDSARKERCVTMLTPDDGIEACVSDPEGLECEDDLMLEEAVRTLNSAKCQDLNDDKRLYECWRLVADEQESDDDEDGLSNLEESEYGTDPDNPDTDEDGYLDGDEVNAGYNPNGEGTL
jgi:hypothetical protein